MPKTCHSALVTAVTLSFLDARPRLLRRLGRAFPTTCPGRVEDSVHEGLAIALSYCAEAESCVHRRWRERGAAGLVDLIYQFAWRHLRGEHRRKSNRVEVNMKEVPERAHRDDPEARLQAAQTATRVGELIPKAAQQFARRHALKLSEALEDRLVSGDTDKDVAERHDVHRSSLCRCRNWLQEAVEADIG